MTQDKPALFAASAMIAGILIARRTSVNWMLWTILSLFLLGVALFLLFRYRRLDGREIFTSSVFLFTILFSSAARYSVENQLPSAANISNLVGLTDSLTMVCRIADEPKIRNRRFRVLVDVIALSNDNDSMGVEGKAYLSIIPDRRKKERIPRIPYGSMITFKSVLQEPSDSRNPGEFSYKDYLALHDIHAVISVFGFSHIKRTHQQRTFFLFEKIIFPVKDFIIRTITSNLKGDNAYFLIGLLLGDRSDISREIKNAFMNTGTIHVLAVSGAHVLIVVTVIFTIFGLLRFPRKVKIVATIVMLGLYVLLTGGTPSVIRASIMASIILLGKLFQERVNVYNTLGLSAVILLLVDPKQLFNVGFQLSFSAVFSIVYFYPKLEHLISLIPEKWEEVRMVKWLWQAFAVSTAAQIGTIPFTALYFGRVSLVSFFANLVVVPLVGVLVPIGIAGVLFSIVSSFIGSCFFEVNNLVAWFTLTFVRLAEQVPFATVNTALFGLKDTFIYFTVVGLIFNIRDRLIVKRIVLFGLLGSNMILYSSLFDDQIGKLQVTFLDVGQGDAAVIRFPQGQTVLVDAGPISSGMNAGEKIVAPYLRKQGISTIDAVISTHPHADHIGGMPYIMEHFRIKEVIDQDQRAGSKLFAEYDSLKHTLPSGLCRAGMQPLQYSNIRVYCLHPSRSFLDTDGSDGYTDLNESSIVLKLVYGSTSFLLTGDAEQPAENNMVRWYGDFLDSDVLKAGHHGSITSSSELFLEEVTPHDAVISVGRFNKFHHPSSIVIDRLKAMHAIVHRTDEEGAVVFESDGHTITHLRWR